MYSHKRNAGASGDRPDGEMGVRKAEEAEMDNGQLTIRRFRRVAKSHRVMGMRIATGLKALAMTEET